MKLKDLNPKLAYRDLQDCLTELTFYKNYKKIILELSESGRLEELGFSLDEDGNLYLGINLNPELLMYSETSQESVELRLISEKMGKYNDFLTKEGLLDSVKMESERIKNENFYGYILKISFNFKKYSKEKYKHAILCLAANLGLVIGSLTGLLAIIF